MYLSKVQVKNLVVKNFGKYSISRSLKGRVCYYSTSGYKFTEKEAGFIKVSYFAPTGEVSSSRVEEKQKAVYEVLVSNGFEFDGIDGYRKER